MIPANTKKWRGNIIGGVAIAGLAALVLLIIFAILARKDEQAYKPANTSGYVAPPAHTGGPSDPATQPKVVVRDYPRWFGGELVIVPAAAQKGVSDKCSTNPPRKDKDGQLTPAGDPANPIKYRFLHELLDYSRADEVLILPDGDIRRAVTFRKARTTYLDASFFTYITTKGEPARLIKGFIDQSWKPGDPNPLELNDDIASMQGL
jgi:hypothetical protein